MVVTFLRLGRAVSLIPKLRQSLVERFDGGFFLLQQIGDEGLLAVFKRLRFRKKLLDIIDFGVVGIPHRTPFYPQIVVVRLAGANPRGCADRALLARLAALRRGSPSLRFLIAAKRRPESRPIQVTIPFAATIATSQRKPVVDAYQGMPRKRYTLLLSFK